MDLPAERIVLTLNWNVQH